MAANQLAARSTTAAVASSGGQVVVRQRRRGPNGMPEVVATEPPQLEPYGPSAEPEILCEPDTARLRLVLIRVMQGRTQAEMAQEFDVTDRTIRNWVAEAKRRRLAAFRSFGPEEMLARTDHLHALLRATLLRRLESAEAAGDDRAIEACCRELRSIERDRYAVRQSIGYFDGWTFHRAADDEDPQQQGAALLVAAIAEVFGRQPARQEDESRPTAAGHDEEPLVEP